MASMDSEVHSLNGARLRTLLWPREHGAWGILLVPLVTGAAVGLMHGGSLAAVLLFLAASLALFCLRTPVESLLGASAMRAQKGPERQWVLLGAAVYGAIALATLAALFWGGRNRGLFLLGAAAAVSFGVQAALRKLGRSTRTGSQIIGSLGLTSTAAGAYYVTTGQLDAHALALWGANWLFAANQILFVQLRLHAAKVESVGKRFAHGWHAVAGLGITLALLLGAFEMGLMPKRAVLAYHPMMLRNLWWFFQKPRPLNVHRLGIRELISAAIFGVIFILALVSWH
ncbi:MAG: YwiC-like family protein [Acidobacteriia bacterium]|nr:YwiC-like family protein [Terriglobia bacterium]